MLNITDVNLMVRALQTGGNSDKFAERFWKGKMDFYN